MKTTIANLKKGEKAIIKDFDADIAPEDAKIQLEERCSEVDFRNAAHLKDVINLVSPSQSRSI